MQKTNEREDSFTMILELIKNSQNMTPAECAYSIRKIHIADLAPVERKMFENHLISFKNQRPTLADEIQKYREVFNFLQF